MKQKPEIRRVAINWNHNWKYTYCVAAGRIMSGFSEFTDYASFTVLIGL